MSEHAVEVIRRTFDQASRVTDPSGRVLDVLDRDTRAVVFDSFDPQIEVQEDPRFPEAGLYRGREAVGRYFSQFTENFDAFTFEAEDFIDLDEQRALVVFRLRTRGKGSGATVEEQPGWIYTIHGGKVMRIEAYLDHREAFAAAGLG
ncbi:MAG: nuclear transport factor 2 family protein, partial [Solirubrobacterales bacterium]